MLRINLLPVRKIKQQFLAKRQLKFFGIAVVALVIALAIFAWILFDNVKSLETENKQLKKKEQELAKIWKKIEELKDYKEKVEERTKKIKELEQTKALSAHVLDEVAKIAEDKVAESDDVRLHERIWLTSLNQKGGDAGKLDLTGNALDNQTISDYLKKLEASKYLSNVTLTSSTLVRYASRNLKAFKISCTVKDEAAAKSINTAAAAKK